MHKLTLPKHPNVLFLVIVFDLLALVAAYGFYATNWVGEAGIPVKLSSHEAHSYELSDHHVVVKIFTDRSNNCVVGQSAVPLNRLKHELNSLKEERGIDQVLLMIDEGASVSRERSAIAITKELDLSCILVTSPSE